MGPALHHAQRSNGAITLHQRVKDEIQSDALSDRFIRFLNDVGNGSQEKAPATKRQKTSLHLEDCEHVLVRRSKLLVKLPNARLQNLDGTIHLQNVPVSINITAISQNICSLKVFDTLHTSTLLNTTVPMDNVPLQDLQIASLVAKESMSTQNPSGQGRLWTEIDLRVGHDGNCDYMEVFMTVKWNITTSISHLPPRRVNRPALQAVLASYFCYSGHDSEQKDDAWSPQSFYSSVHVPGTEDAIPDLSKINNGYTDLYPFQKRSVGWLMEREGFQWPNVSETPSSPKTDSPEHTKHLPYSFYQGADGNGQMCYLSRFFNIVTKDLEPFRQIENLRGGILAEEMGLGKTVEIIALISLHQWPHRDLEMVLDQYTLTEVRSCRTTLIITPPSILSQWITELDRHSPSLKVIHYEGLKAHKGRNVVPVLDQLTSCDVVLTTYNVLSSEIHYALSPDRQLRREKKYERPKSPLMQILWWRVCLDEAQMIESGVSNAATVARLIPRVNAWSVTGTPVQKDVNDLLGLLVFLRLEPFVSRPYLWSSLLSDNQEPFKSIFKQLALRHTKQFVRDELQLPLQQRYVITVPFTPIEEQHYQSLFQQMCDDCGLDLQGNPLANDWDPEENKTVERMRGWLTRLRQTALHPEIGEQNRRALGYKKKGPLRTLNDVLIAMMDQVEISLRTDLRALLLAKLKRGQTYENGPEVKRALEIWTEVLHEANSLVTESRQQLRREILVNHTDGSISDTSSDTSDISDTDSQENKDKVNDEASAKVAISQIRLRQALEIQHVAIFFQANGYFQLRTDKELTKPDSQQFKDLEKSELEGYERAKQVRREILKEPFRKANKLMIRLSKQNASQTFAQIPEFTSSLPQGGVQIGRIIEQLNALGEILNNQAICLAEWREQTIQILLRPLVDEDEGLEVNGDEYEQSTKTQEEVEVNVRALRAVIEDRHDALTGQENLLVESEARAGVKHAESGDGPFPRRLLQLFTIRERIKPPKGMASIRGIISELRALATTLQIDADNGNSRAAKELAIVEQERQTIQQRYAGENKAIVALRQEIDFFTTLMNNRLEYYRQLQRLSDTVRPLKEEEKERWRGKMKTIEEICARKIATSSAKRRYLIHLQHEAKTDPSQQRLCVICQSTFELGALTVCGHQFCKECMGLWWNAHRNCPVCKRKLSRRDLHDITYKPQELRLAEEIVKGPSADPSLKSSRDRLAIYSDISNNILAQIKNIDLHGPSFTTKVDTLARHLLWLRTSDPGAKSIIFSQFKEFLDILGRALASFRIGFTTIDKPGGIEQFRKDPGTECFLLHAKAHSSGLNLINASHVFLCEPLINTAIELQAIARVHRIGQQQATTVWLYIIDGTVEEYIYQISVRRRLEHLDRSGKGKATELTAELLDSSNSMELQHVPPAKLLTKGRTGGEVVDQSDLWSCLFGSGNKRVQSQNLE